METQNLPLLRTADAPAVATTDAIPENGDPFPRERVHGGQHHQQSRTFSEEGDSLYCAEGKRIANFTLRIIGEKVHVDGDSTLGRSLCLELRKDGNQRHFWLKAHEFAGTGLTRRIYEVQGGDAIIDGSAKELRIAVQQLSPRDRPVAVTHIANGFVENGARYLVPPGIEISGRGVTHLEGEDVELAGTYGRRIRFDLVGHKEQVDLARHIVVEFLELKDHKVMYPLMGHISLGPFSSLIPSITGAQKPAVHLMGASGGGKTFLASRAADFFGDFEGHIASWSSTANALEALGHEAKDALYVVDDYKPGLTSETDLLRVVQNHANGQGRSRLRAGGKADEGPAIRGLLLSTGEGFPESAESVAGRTILLEVDTSHNQLAGKACLERRREYPRFLPGLIHNVMARPHWVEDFRGIFEAFVQNLLKALPGFPNNLRIASNWALNATGFGFFLAHLCALGAIPAEKCSEMASEYRDIVGAHIRAYAERMAAMNPTEVFRDIVSQKLATGAVSIATLELPFGEGKCIGTLKMEGLYLFPEAVMEMLTRHFAASPSFLLISGINV